MAKLLDMSPLHSNPALPFSGTGSKPAGHGTSHTRAGAPPGLCRITDRLTAEKLIDDLRIAVRNSRRSGGEYTVFIRDAKTDALAEIAVHLGGS